MSNKHTPGEWIVSFDGNHVIDDAGGILATIAQPSGCQWKRSEREQQKIANGHIFSAGPNMLEALKDAQSELSVQQKINSYVFGKVSDAIAKAEGRDQ